MLFDWRTRREKKAITVRHSGNLDEVKQEEYKKKRERDGEKKQRKSKYNQIMFLFGNLIADFFSSSRSLILCMVWLSIYTSYLMVSLCFYRVCQLDYFLDFFSSLFFSQQPSVVLYTNYQRSVES